MNIVAHEPILLAWIRELYSHRPQALYLEAWELQSLLFLLGYTDSLTLEADIAAAMEVARTDWTPGDGEAA
jgi:hypothetical protein